MMECKKSLRSYTKIYHNATFDKQKEYESEVIDYISKERCVHRAWLWGACQGPILRKKCEGPWFHFSPSPPLTYYTEAMDVMGF